MKKKTAPVTDHTKAILIALAYLIGFTTAYIAFQLNDVSPSYAQKDTRAVENKIVQQASAYGAVKAVTTSEGLFVSSDGEERIISATADGEDLEFGFHREIISSSVSPDGSMVYYSATMDESDSCYHFVYVVGEDMVYPVRSGDDLLVTPSATAQTSVWLSNNLLSIEGAKSVDANTPWLMP